MNESFLKTLTQSPLFAGITPEALAGVVECLQPKVSLFPKASYVAAEGEPFTGLGILLDGKAAVIKENAAGQRIVMTLLGPGDMFGEMFVFSAGDTWPLSVFTQEDCRVMFLPSIKIVGTCSKVCANHKQIIINLLNIISEKAILLNRKVEYLAIRGMREKICVFLLEQYKKSASRTFTLTLNRNDLADFLNVSRTALSREMGRMRDEGMIDYYRSSIKIKDPEALKKVVE